MCLHTCNNDCVSKCSQVSEYLRNIIVHIWRLEKTEIYHNPIDINTGMNEWPQSCIKRWWSECLFVSVDYGQILQALSMFIVSITSVPIKSTYEMFFGKYIFESYFGTNYHNSPVVIQWPSYYCISNNGMVPAAALLPTRTRPTEMICNLYFCFWQIEQIKS